MVKLQQLARARGLSGVSRLRKADLIEELLSA
ncbi:MAG: Rho termination factor N-terminal domain-containing protein [Vulcanococcus sp.]